MSRNYSAQKPRGFKSHTHQLMRKKVKTKVEPSSMHWEPVASTIRRQQQSYVNVYKSKDRFWTNSWMPEMQKGIHLRLASPSVSQIWFDTMTKNGRDWGRCTLSIEREFPKSIGERVHGRGLAPLLLSWKHQDKVRNLLR